MSEKSWGCLEESMKIVVTVTGEEGASDDFVESTQTLSILIPSIFRRESHPPPFHTIVPGLWV